MVAIKLCHTLCLSPGFASPLYSITIPLIKISLSFPYPLYGTILGLSSQPNFCFRKTLIQRKGFLILANTGFNIFIIHPLNLIDSNIATSAQILTLAFVITPYKFLIVLN